MKNFSLIVIAAITAISSPAFCQDKPNLFSKDNSPVIIGTETYPRLVLQDAFLNAALSKAYKSNGPFTPMLPLDRYLLPNTATGDFLEKSTLARRYPWLASLIYAQPVPANQMIFHKWTKPITVALGYPNDFKPYEDVEAWKKGGIASIASHQGGYRKPEVNVWAQEQIQEDAPELAKASGLNINFIPKDEESAANIANIRVVFVRSSAFGKSKYKSDGTTAVGEGEYPIEMVENVLPYVGFTPYVDNQLSGYFVPNYKGEIEFAVCKIMEDHPKEIIQKLVRECLVRSMGFPSLSSATPSILSNWNDPSWKNKDVSSKVDGSLSDIDLYYIQTLYNQSISAGETIDDIL